MTDKERILMAQAIATPPKIKNIAEAEYSVFSQWGDDGIIQYLINRLDLSGDFFVEFGVENYLESNTRFLLMNNNWSGFVMDGSAQQVKSIQSSEYYWKYDLVAKQAFVNQQNILSMLSGNCPDQINLLHIDIDGMDYWIWKTISTEIKPEIVILEYNSVFGSDRSITVPYDANFVRHKAHYSGLYAGASLPALYELSKAAGYAFIGTNSAGNNAYFVQRKLLNNSVAEKSLEEGFVQSKFRESRDPKGKLTYFRGENRADIIRGLPVLDTVTNSITTF